MNILPKKRWHVRTKDNIARVRKDEAEARELERKKQEKLQFAESEARINFLRKQSGLPERQSTNVESTETTSSNEPSNSEHVELFADYKTHIKTTNKDLEKEKKEEQEKYEKQIGYLTYLGQDTNEALKFRSWYEVAPKRAAVGDSEVVEKDLKTKHSHDPLTLINALLPPEKLPPKQQQRSTKRPPSVETTRTASAEPERKIPKITEKLHKTKKEKKHKKEKRSKKEKRNKKEKKNKDRRLREAEEKQHKREKLEKLRKERLRREATERARQEALLAPKEADVPEKKDPNAATTPRIVQKYNSQFNPDLAKQNML